MPSWTPVVIVNTDDTPSTVLDEILATLQEILFQLQVNDRDDENESTEVDDGEGE